MRNLSSVMQIEVNIKKFEKHTGLIIPLWNSLLIYHANILCIYLLLLNSFDTQVFVLLAWSDFDNQLNFRL